MYPTRGLALAAVLAFRGGRVSQPAAGWAELRRVGGRPGKTGRTWGARRVLQVGLTPRRLPSIPTPTARRAFRDLKPGKYQVSIALKGFEPVEREIDLAPGGPLLLDVTLTPSLQKTQIEVKGRGQRGGARVVAGDHRYRATRQGTAQLVRRPWPMRCRWFPAWCAIRAAACASPTARRIAAP